MLTKGFILVIQLTITVRLCFSLVRFPFYLKILNYNLFIKTSYSFVYIDANNQTLVGCEASSGAEIVIPKSVKEIYIEITMHSRVVEQSFQLVSKKIVKLLVFRIIVFITQV